MQGLIVKAISGFYYVDGGETVYECKARGNFRNTGVSPVVGDRVEITLSGQTGVVSKVLPRRNYFNRPALANLDKLFIVSSFSTPSPDAFMIDRLTALCAFSGIEPVIVFNKSDTGDFSDWRRLYERAGFKTYVISALCRTGLDSIKRELSHCVSAVAGCSGVGKSSMLNALFPELSLKTNTVSEKLGRGRHTTRHTQLFPHPFGGYIADTPGFSSLEIAVDDQAAFQEHLCEYFPDFHDYTDQCFFSSCTHTCEKGCAVLEAVRAHQIEPTRHQSYQQILKQLQEGRSWKTR